MPWRKGLVGWLLAVTALYLVKPGAAAGDAAAELRLTNGERQAVFTRTQLLARPDLETVHVEKDPAYGDRPMTYKAVRATALFQGLNVGADAVIQFRCLDGFAAPIDKDRLLNTNPARSIAYIAIEDPRQSWPHLKPGAASAGPFYLIWRQPELSHIGQEEWPFQLAAFETHGTLAALYPKILPDPSLKDDAPARRGFAVFSKNCFACHTLNRNGSSEVGPDLNLPMNPTEYLTEAALRRLVRNPQDLRYFPRSRMSAFPPTVLTDAALDDLIAYLRHMASRKQP